MTSPYIRDDDYRYDEHREHPSDCLCRRCALDNADDYRGEDE